MVLQFVCRKLVFGANLENGIACTVKENAASGTKDDSEVVVVSPSSRRSIFRRGDHFVSTVLFRGKRIDAGEKKKTANVVRRLENTFGFNGISFYGKRTIRRT